MRRLTALALGCLAVVGLASPADALSKDELSCQMAIARAGRSYVSRELASRSLCRRKAVLGIACDPAPRSAVHATRLARTVERCDGVDTSNLNAGGCAETSIGVDHLAGCLLDTHDALIEQILDEQFGD